MAEVIRYVDPDAAGAANGTSWTDAYTSLSAWEAAEQTDLVAAGNWHHVYCRSSAGTVDATIVVVDTWTTDSTNYIHIEVAASDSHAGIRPTTTYRIEVSSAWNPIVDIKEPYTVVDGIAVSNSNATSTQGIRCSATNCEFLNCMVYDCAADGFVFTSGADTLTLINCVAMSSAALGFSLSGHPSTVYNCVAVNCGTYGFWGIGFITVNYKNCYAGGNTTASFGDDGNPTINFTTSASDDGHAGTTTIAWSTTHFTVVTDGSADVHLPGTGSSAYNAGTDLAADATYAFDYDFEGDTRSQWDIGADEYVAAGGAGDTFIEGLSRIAYGIKPVTAAGLGGVIVE